MNKNKRLLVISFVVAIMVVFSSIWMATGIVAAANRGSTWSQTEETKVIIRTPGDANLDGNIDIGDVVKVERQILGLDPTLSMMADANGDGKINMGDVTAIERHILGRGLGDANRDGKVNVQDITWVELTLLGLKVQNINMDANIDGYINKDDIKQIEKLILASN